MNEIEGMKWQLGHYRAILLRQIDRLYNALEELQRTTLMLLDQEVADTDIDEWLEAEGFQVDEDGFFQSMPLLTDYRQGLAPADSISFSWGKHLRDDSNARQRLFIHRRIGSHLKHIHDRLGDVGWIYYQDAGNVSLQYPFIDQCTAIPSDFDWKTYHTYISVCPENNPDRKIRWTPPTVDYAGEGLILSLSIPVWKNDEFIGLWSIDLPVRYLYSDFASTEVCKENIHFIADHDGMLILHKDLQAEIDQTKGRVFLHSLAEIGGQWGDFNVHDILDKDSPDGELSIKDETGTEWLFCYSDIPKVQWLLFCGMPTTAMEEAAAKRLSQAFKQIAEGNFSHRIDAASFSALPTLVDEFNRMSRRLNQVEKHRQEIEAQLRQAQKMEAVGRLAGGVAHDYNNMITVIIGYAEMVLDEIDEENPLFSHIQQIYEAGRRSMELTRQLLAFARRQAISPKVLDINETVASMLKMLKRLIGEDIEILWHPGENVWPVKIDPSQIDQILANLSVNARDAISGVGKLVIETSNTILDEEYCALHRGFIPGKYIQLTVSDDGIGIDREILDKIFEPFFSTKAIGRGTGLGLATVYGIVKQNDGFINVYSEPGKGTTFKIFFPMVEKDKLETVGQTQAMASPGNGETILLVEDEAAILRLVEKMLKQLNYRVLATSSSLEAIAIAKDRRNKIDLLLTDVIMPELNGKDLAKRLTTIQPGLKVLFMSGYTANTIANHGVLSEDVFLIEKPFSSIRLSDKIKETLNNHPAT